jgi:hypothetical protein
VGVIKTEILDGKAARVPKETDLRDLVQTLGPKTRDDLRRVLICDLRVAADVRD